MTKLATPAINVLGGPFKPSFGLSGPPRFPQAPDVIRSEAEGSAVPRTFPGNVFRQSAAEWRDLRLLFPSHPRSPLLLKTGDPGCTPEGAGHARLSAAAQNIAEHRMR